LIKINKEFFNRLEKELPSELVVYKDYEIPKSEYGDFAFPCFSLAKVQKKNPAIIAKELSIELNKKFSDIGIFNSTGGYLNFKFLDKVFAEGILNEVIEKKSRLGWEKSTGKIATIDFSSPNIAKPFSIGHLRSTSIGNSIKNIMIANGIKVIGVNHIGDWGTQFGKLIYAYREWGDEELLNKDGVKHLFDLYVKFHKESEANKVLDDLGRKEFKKLENGDEANRQLWNQIRDISLDEFIRIYKRLGVEFENYTGESFYEDKLDDVVKRLEKKGLLIESDGAIIVDLEEDGLPPALIKKTDGTTLYLTRDLAAAIYRKEVLNADYLLYVVGSEQRLHFEQLKAVIKRLGYEWYENIVHIDFGLFRFSGEKMSTRKGKVIFMEDVLNEAKETILSIIDEKNPDLSEKEKIAEEIGAGAIIFGDLVNERIKNITFTWEKMMQFEGDTGPYVQYAHARCRSILRKGEISDEHRFSIPEEIDVYERELLREVLIYSVKINKSLESYKPHYIAESLLQITKAFNRFYQNCPVLSSEENTKQFRVSLVKMTADVLKGGMGLLGMSSPNQM